MKKFTTEPLSDIFDYLEEKLLEKDEALIEVLNPDFGIKNYAGEELLFDGIKYKYRSYKSWNDLAEIFFCKLLTPIISSKYTVILKFKKINKDESFHNKSSKDLEKYGEESTFFRINKNEESSFYFYYKQALLNSKIEIRNSVLNLGVNKADEFEMIEKLVLKNKFKEIKFVGIDFCSSAINFAKKRFDSSNFNFLEYDISKLNELNLGKFDLIISIGTLQSTSLNFKEVFMNLIQNYLSENGALILGFPNCRWYEGELIYGAKAANYSFNEQSVLIKDIYFCKKYLQQKKFRVTLTGKSYIFLTATKIKSN